MHLTICLFSTWPYKSKIWPSILASKRSFSRVCEIVCYLQSPWNRSEIISQYLSPSVSSMRPAPVATAFLIIWGSAFEKGQIQFQSPYFDQHHHEDIHLLYLSYVHIFFILCCKSWFKYPSHLYVICSSHVWFKSRPSRSMVWGELLILAWSNLPPMSADVIPLLWPGQCHSCTM